MAPRRPIIYYRPAPKRHQALRKVVRSTFSQRPSGGSTSTFHHRLTSRRNVDRMRPAAPPGGGFRPLIRGLCGQECPIRVLCPGHGPASGPETSRPVHRLVRPGLIATQPDPDKPPTWSVAGTHKPNGLTARSRSRSPLTASAYGTLGREGWSRTGFRANPATTCCRRLLRAPEVDGDPSQRDRPGQLFSFLNPVRAGKLDTPGFRPISPGGAGLLPVSWACGNRPAPELGLYLAAKPNEVIPF